MFKINNLWLLKFPTMRLASFNMENIFERPHKFARCIMVSAVALLVASAAGFACLTWPSFAATGEERDDVVIFLPGPLPGNVMIADQIRAVLSAVPRPLEFHTEFVEESRFPDEEYGRLLHAFLRGKYAMRPVRLVFAVGPAALNFLIESRADLFPEVPIVFTGVRPADVKAPVGPPAGMTGVWRPLVAAETLDAALRLQPDTERVVVIAGTSQSERAFLQDVRAALAPSEKRVQVSYLTGRPMRDVVASVATLPPRTIVLYQMLQRDSEGTTFVPHEALASISKASSVPVYGLFEPYVGHGVVGGLVISFADVGARTGRLAAEILTASPGAPLPPPNEAPGIYRFDWRELQRWRLDERRLPPGATVVNRGPGWWQTYGWSIGIALLSLVEAVLITVLFLQWRRRRRAERSLGERLRFEELVSKLNAGLVAVRGADVPAEVRLGLRQLGEFLRVDRLTLVEFEEQVGGALHGYRWARPGVERAPILTLEHFPWLIARLRRREIVRFSRLEELPPEAAIDRQTYQSVGTRSFLAVPLLEGDAMLGGLFFSTVETEREWPDELLQRLPLLGEVFVNVLARRRADEALTESRALSGAIVDSLPGRVVVIDRAGRVIAVNEAVQYAAASGNSDSRWLAIDADYLAPWRHAHASGDRGAGDVLKGIEAVLAGESSHFSLEYQLADDPRQRWFEFRVDPLRLRAGGAVVSQMDITDRKRAEVETQRMREELTRVGRVTTLGQLTAALAHEVNQPLTGILANAQAACRFLAKEQPDLDEVRAILDDIVADDRRASDVVHRLRSMLKRRDPERTSIDVNQLVRDVARFLHSDAMLRNASLVQDLEAEVPPIRGDLVQLQQVLVNLVLNGLDAMKHLPPERRRLIVKTEHKDEAVCIAVRDFGTGLPASGSDRLFEPFYTTKPEGMGIGLSIARSIVEAHGGRLWAANNEDQGATFFCTLPVVDAVA
jgi:two-component system, LuxR family, sensor kinase FixL